ncbi:guanylate kinase [Psychromonas sp. Urea-02u-13]|uniref:guanylate kinase n=1 Tax=Psychromonas sp. Urea-02u-13 TaxID=2058326 RepID=UPI000C31E842|nr:guanylate kinase [Psychromonas sp. Urea-02u-13]PKG40109.1 guanylate kinase [Psychromonas sp. Urea-02u-13]
MPQLGTLYIISAPSGAGKSSLINALLAEERSWDVQVSVSHTTRAPRVGENNAEHYHFVDVDNFKSLIKENAFFEWAEVFGNYYGTSRITIEQALQQGTDIFLDIDWQGAQQVREMMPEAVGIFVLPPNRDELESRLNKRGQDSSEIIAKRMAQAQSEMSHYNEYDYLIINDDFELASKELSNIVSALRNKQSKQSLVHQTMIAALLK